MAQGKITVGTILIVLAIVCTGAEAQSSSCTNTLISLSPCLNYITGNTSTPSSQCCSQLKNVVRSSPQCLCQVLNGGGSSLGINVNQTQALALPGACNVKTPPTSQCKAASPAPAGSPAKTPSTSDTPTDTGSNTDPSTVDGTSDGSSIKLSISLLLCLIFAASYGSIFTGY